MVDNEGVHMHVRVVVAPITEIAPCFAQLRPVLLVQSVQCDAGSHCWGLAKGSSVTSCNQNPFFAAGGEDAEVVEDVVIAG